MVLNSIFKVSNNILHLFIFEHLEFLKDKIQPVNGDSVSMFANVWKSKLVAILFLPTIENAQLLAVNLLKY